MFGHRVWPIWIIPIWLVAVNIDAIASALQSEVLWSGVGTYLGYIGALAAFIILVSLATWGVLAASESEVVRIAKGYVRAKKEKVCPIVEITDDD